MEYVYFYINTIFGLHGLYMMSLFAVSWLLSGSWLAGVLATFFFIFNKYVFLMCPDKFTSICKSSNDFALSRVLQCLGLSTVFFLVGWT